MNSDPYWFTGKRVTQRKTRARKIWYGPFESHADAVRWARANGFRNAK